MPTTPPRDPRDQPLDPPVESAFALSVRDLLAACAAARTVSTPPEDEPAAPQAPRAADRDAA